SDYQENFELADRWILSRLNRTIEKVTENLHHYGINESFNAIYHFFWDEFCDWYLEMIKPRLSSEEDTVEKITAQTVATHVLKTCMNLLHPYIPFITEEIWQRLKNEGETSIVVHFWPQVESALFDDAAEREMRFIQDAIGGIRTTRSEMNVPPSKKAKLLYRTSDDHRERLLNKYEDYIKRLSRTESIAPIRKNQDLKSTATLVIDNTELFIPLADLINLEAERQRLEKEIDRISNQVVGLQKKLSNEDFLQKAPEQVVQRDKEKLQSFTEKLNKLKANLDRL
ncbi:class I tRNA ligase family protein, partial [Candidatus Saccharibacteria bacterium]|nr:class I tRNA ligase family protein [Candidatus Saccharibacteria bacterium]NIW79229.1 class I tRNA ligase family protein [Calditrichia bacterium]